MNNSVRATPLVALSIGVACVGCSLHTDFPANQEVSRLFDEHVGDTGIPESTNVMILLIDDVGVDRFAVYGAKFPAPTPVIDGLAAEGVVFDSAWGYSLCSPSRAALQTGRHARRTGFGQNPEIVGGSETELEPGLLTLAELVDHSPNATWASSYVGKWHLAWYDSPDNTLAPLAQGWDWWSGSMANINDYNLWKKVQADGTEFLSPVYATTDNTDDALARAAIMPEPWLMQVSFNGAHVPFHVPPSELHTDSTLTIDSPSNDLHRAMLEAVDTEIGRLLDGLPPEVRQRTMVFVLGDNGTPASALEGESKNPGRAKSTVYDGGVRIPFIVSGADVVARGRIRDFAHVVDIFPTLADIAGIDVSKFGSALDPSMPLEVDGVSLLPILTDPHAKAARKTLYTEEFRPGGAGPFSTDTRALRTATHKLIRNEACGFDEFFEYQPGAYDEGPDLLKKALLTPEQEAAYALLSEEIDATTARLTYDSSTWPESPADLVPCTKDAADDVQ